MIIYNIQPDGQATNFQYSKTCPEGYKSIDSDKIPQDVTGYHEQRYIDHLASVDYIEKRKENYPDPMVLNDAKVKQSSTTAEMVVEGEAQEQKYYADCLAVKEQFPKPTI